MTSAILVVDRSPITRRIINVALQTYGYAVLAAENSAAARTLVSGHSVDLILHDAATPEELHGLADIARHPKGAPIPIIALVPALAEDSLPSALFADRLSKPIAPSDLIARVDAHVAAARARAAFPARGQRRIVVAGDPLVREAARLRLVAAGFDVDPVTDNTAEEAHRRHQDAIAVIEVIAGPAADLAEGRREGTADIVVAVDAFVRAAAAGGDRRLSVRVATPRALNLALERQLALQQVPALAEAAEEGGLEDPLSALFPACLDAIGALRGALHVHEAGGFITRAHVGLSATARAALEGFSSHDVVHAGDEPLCIARATASPREAALLADLAAATVAIVPLSALGERLGALIVVSAHESLPRDWLDVARTLAAHLAQTLRLRRADAERAASDQRYRRLFDAASDGLITSDQEGRILDANAVAQRLTEYSVEELRRQTVADLFPTSGDAQSAPTAGRPLRRRSGPPRFVEVVENPIASGTRLFLVRDVTEREAIRDRLHQSEKLATMGFLLAAVAHELSNPLSVILTASSLLEHEKDPATCEHWRAQIARAAERSSGIVQSFLTRARQSPVERRAVNLNLVVNEAIDMLAYRLRVDGIEICTDLAVDLPSVNADPQQIHEVVVNLVSNAQQAMRDSALPRRLGVRTRRGTKPRHVALDVSDSGPGISPEIAARIFEPFFTTKPPGQGTGLGLSLCHRVVEAHGGTIQVAKAEGRGALFSLELPEAGTERVAAERAAETHGRKEAPCSILIVDDETDVSSIIQDVLVREGHRVTTAADGAAALELLTERSFDLILTDFRMPVLDGVTLFHEVTRRDPGTAGRFVFMTGDTLTTDTRRFLEESGATRLSKPFSAAQLREIVGTIRGRS